MRNNRVFDLDDSRLPGDFSNISYERLQPQAIQLEEALIGAFLLDSDSLTSVIDILKVETFYKPSHQIIYSAILSLFERSLPIDIVSLSEELRKNSNLEVIGGLPYLLELSNKVSTTQSTLYYARIIVEKYIKREIIRTSTIAIKEAFDDSTDTFELISKTESALYEITNSVFGSTVEKLSTIIRSSIKNIEEISNSPDRLIGVGSGFYELDKVTNGWQDSALIILAARPGVGKSSLMLSFARNAAIDYNRPVAIFSLEMSKTELANRLLSIESTIEANKFKTGKLLDEEWPILNRAGEFLSDAPIYIDDNPSLNIFELRAKCRRLKKHSNISLVIIDYLQLMNGSDNTKRGNREQEISNISRGLKALAKELKIPVIALAQLSREAERSKKPMLSHLRESGSIEANSDVVMFLHRSDDYEEELTKPKGYTELIIAKHRSGSIAEIPLVFKSETTKYIEFNEESSYLISPPTPVNINIKPSGQDEDIPF